MSAIDDDLRAINDFFHRPENAPKTPAAKAVFNEWVTWWEETQPGTFGWWSQADKDHASNLRNQYNRANAVTPHEKEVAERVIRTGLSTEQMMGETDRRNAEGGYNEPPPDEPPPGLTKRWWFWPSVASGGTLAVVFIVPKVVKAYLGLR